MVLRPIPALLSILFTASTCAQLDRGCLLFDIGNFQSTVGAVQDADGGFVVLGNRSGGLVQDLTLTKLDAGGSLMWCKQLDSGFDEQASNLHPTADGGYVIGGTSTVNGLRRLLLMKVDADGVIQWARTYGASSVMLSLNQSGFKAMPDGGSVFCASEQGEGGVYVLRADASGTPIWSVHVGIADRQGRAVAAAANNEVLYTAAGSDEGIPGEVGRINTAGTVLWRKGITLGVGQDFVPNDIGVRSDGTVAVAGYQFPTSGSGSGFGSEDMGLLSLSSAGLVDWYRTIGTPLIDRARTVAVADDGSCFIAGRLFTSSSGVEAVRMDASGNLLWARVLSYSSDPFFPLASSIATDGQLLLTGQFGFNSIRTVLWKVGIGGDVCPDCPSTQLGSAMNNTMSEQIASPAAVTNGWAIVDNVTFTATDITTSVLSEGSTCGSNAVDDVVAADEELTIIPDPFRNEAIIRTPQHLIPVIRSLDVHDATGRLVRRVRITLPSTPMQREGLAPGNYFYRLITTTGEDVGGSFRILP